MLSRKKVLAYSIAAALFPSVSSASFLLDRFNSSNGAAEVQVTEGQTYEHSLGTTIYGGNISLRRRVSQPGDFISIERPSLKGGCGGFDLFKGSFSYISGERLIGHLEDIASNAEAVATYAFLTSLANSCTVCTSTMNMLEDATRMVNQFSRNSCEMGTALANQGPINFAKNTWGEMKEAWKEFNDGLEDEMEYEKNGDPTEGVPDDKKRKVYPGNVILGALTKHNVYDQFSAAFSDSNPSKREFYDLVMSMTGVVTVSAPGSSPTNQPGGNTTNSSPTNQSGSDAKITNYPPTVRLDHLVGDSVVSVDLITCDTSSSTPYEAYSEYMSDSCPNVRVDASGYNLEGAQKRFKEVFEGSNGILELLSSPDNNVKDANWQEARDFISFYQGRSQLISSLAQLSSNPSMMRRYYREAIEAEAVEVTYYITKEIMDKTLQALEMSKEDLGGVDLAIELVMSSKQALEEDYRAYIEANEFMKADPVSTLNNYLDLINKMKSAAN